MSSSLLMCRGELVQVTNHDVDGRSRLGYSYTIPRVTLSPVRRGRSDPMPQISPYIPRGDGLA